MTFEDVIREKRREEALRREEEREEERRLEREEKTPPTPPPPPPPGEEYVTITITERADRTNRTSYKRKTFTIWGQSRENIERDIRMIEDEYRAEIRQRGGDAWNAHVSGSGRAVRQ